MTPADKIDETINKGSLDTATLAANDAPTDQAPADAALKAAENQAAVDAVNQLVAGPMEAGKSEPRPPTGIDVQRALRAIATTLYGPNAGGDANRAEVEALFADIIAGE